MLIAQAQAWQGAGGEKLSLAQICGWLDISRQAYYQQAQRQHQAACAQAEILACVQRLRQRHPQLGGRKLLNEITPQLAAKGIQIGRDRFFALLAQQALLVPQARQRRRTTWAGRWRCPNRLAELVLVRANQAWVCDITYLETEQGFCYLSLITDAFSRFIVGYDVATSLAVEGALRALNGALTRAQRPLHGLIHHSDHGVQYTCPLYRKTLHEAHILASMGAIGNCYDNAKAERLNGILKLEYRLGDRLLDFQHAHTATAQAVWLYNYERPHLALLYKKPAEVHFAEQALVP